MKCAVWFNGNSSAYVLFSRTVCSMKQESLPITDSKEWEKLRGEKSPKLSLNSSWKHLSLSQMLKTSEGLQSHIWSWPADLFFKRSMHCRKKTCFAITTFSTTPSSLNYYIPKRLPQSPSYWAEPSFIVHGTSWNGAIVGCWVYSHSKRKSLGPRQASTIPAISCGTAAGRGGRAAC